jgi:hypothetical protein
MKALIAVAAVVVLAGVGLATFLFVRSGSSTRVAGNSGAAPTQPSAPTAAAVEAPAPAESKAAAPSQAAAVAEAVESSASGAGPKTLFPEAAVPPGPGQSAPAQSAAPPVEQPAPPAQASALAQAAPVPEVVTPAPQAPRRATASEAAAPKEAAPKPAAPKEPPPKEGTTEWFVYQGKALLVAGKYQPALQQFAEALKKDRNNADAWHGSGLCYQYMGERNTALERLERAATLYKPPNRAAVFNAAAANLRDNPMRTAKLVKDYLSLDGVPPDEPLHTLMGKALFSVNRQGRQNKTFAEAEAFYFDYSTKLEATRDDGRKRWGGEWVPAAEATAKWSRYRTRREAAERLRAEVDRATKQKKDTWERWLDQKNGMRLRSSAEKREAQQNYERAAKGEIALREQLQRAEAEFNSTEKPPLPQLFKPAPMDETAPPAPATGGQPTLPGQSVFQ